MSLAEVSRDITPGRWQAIADRVLAGGSIDREEALAILEEEGLEQVFHRHTHLAAGVRAAVFDGWKLKLCAKEPKWFSDTVSAILVPEGYDAAKVIARAYARYNTSLGAGLSKVAGKVFRIGHLGDSNEGMMLAAVAIAESAMIDCGIPVEPGSGVAAAGSYFRSHSPTIEGA